MDTQTDTIWSSLHELFIDAGKQPSLRQAQSKIERELVDLRARFSVFGAESEFSRILSEMHPLLSLITARLRQIDLLSASPLLPEELASGSEILSKREAEILTRLNHGEKPKAIAEVLGISLTTVYRHTANIRRKLGAAGANQADKGD